MYGPTRWRLSDSSVGWACRNKEKALESSESVDMSCCNLTSPRVRLRSLGQRAVVRRRISKMRERGMEGPPMVRCWRPGHRTMSIFQRAGGRASTWALSGTMSVSGGTGVQRSAEEYPAGIQPSV